MNKPTCYHQQKQIVWTTVNTHVEDLAVKQLRHQCRDCGKLLAHALPHSQANSNTPSVDLVALKHWAEHDRMFWTKGQEERRELVQQQKDEWRFRYEEYLQSDAWRSRRQRVMERSGGLCEGCRQSKATAVHHLTYDHLGREPLWELVAVCRECHEEVHNLR